MFDIALNKENKPNQNVSHHTTENLSQFRKSWQILISIYYNISVITRISMLKKAELTLPTNNENCSKTRGLEIEICKNEDNMNKINWHVSLLKH